MFLLRLLGGLFVALGAIGVFLPIWPTTIFWIFAALCFARSSPQARDWIYTRPGLGPEIEGFVERGTLSRSGKVAAIIGIAIAMVISGFVLRGQMVWLGILAVTLLAVIVYIAYRPEA